METKTVLISIHPEYAEAIFSGVKKVEFRRQYFRQPVKRIFVYSTKPTQKVVGYFDVDNIFQSSPNKLWKMFNHIGYIDSKKYFDYFAFCDLGIAIHISNPTLFEKPIKLSEIHLKNPPQSYKYLSASEAELLMQLGENKQHDKQLS